MSNEENSMPSPQRVRFIFPNNRQVDSSTLYFMSTLRSGNNRFRDSRPPFTTSFTSGRSDNLQSDITIVRRTEPIMGFIRHFHILDSDDEEEEEITVTINNTLYDPIRETPLDQEILRLIPEWKVSDNTKKTLKDCVVCMTEYNNDETLITLPCFHIYHKDCILEWFKTNDTCPLCKGHVTI